jgi:metal transporter CNNM
VGYLSIKKHSLEAWLESPDQKKVKIAETILGILEHHHLLLSTLLLSNALAMEALPIFLDKIVPAYLAIFISTLAVLIFGEVIPQAYCTGPHQIPIAYFMSGFVKFLQLILGIFVRPIAWALDNWLGHH